MWGAIVGDVCGSVNERRRIKTGQAKDVSLFDKKGHFSDDTVLTVAVAEACLGDRNYAAAIKRWGLKYPKAGYGRSFREWLASPGLDAYNSFGNGSAMRVSPVGWMFGTMDETLREAEATAVVTHNHPEGVKGAQAVAAAIFLARTTRDKDGIKEFITEHFGYDLERTTDQIRPGYQFDSSCQGSVPESIIAFLESDDYAHALQLAISLGGDSDTMACIAGSVAEAFYGVLPENLLEYVKPRLTPELLEAVNALSQRVYGGRE